MDTIEPTTVLLYVLVPCLLFVAVAVYIAVARLPLLFISEEALQRRIRKLCDAMDADIEARRNRSKSSTTEDR